MAPQKQQSAQSNGRAATYGGPHDSFVAEAELDEFGVALDTGTVTFHDVARAWFGLHEKARLGTSLYGKYRDMHRKLLAAFEEPRGGIISSYFCQHLAIAAALTDIETAVMRKGTIAGDQQRRRVTAWEQTSGSAIHVEPSFGHPYDIRSKQLLFRCMDLHYRALEFLPPAQRRMCLRKIFEIIISLLGTLDARAAIAQVEDRATAASLTREEANAFASQLREVERDYQRHVRQRAQWEYFLGMMFGAAVVAAAIAAVAIVGHLTLHDPFCVSVVAGAVGAVISVMRRISRGALRLEAEIGRRMLILLGFIRPLVGTVFGGLTYVVIESGLLTGGKSPSISSRDYLYYAGLAFAAGFTERVASVLSPQLADSGSDAAQDAATSDGAPEGRRRKAATIGRKTETW